LVGVEPTRIERPRILPAGAEVDLARMERLHPEMDEQMREVFNKTKNYQ
jgi:hypothetical protein